MGSSRLFHCRLNHVRYRSSIGSAAGWPQAPRVAGRPLRLQQLPVGEPARLDAVELGGGEVRPQERVGELPGDHGLGYDAAWRGKVTEIPDRVVRRLLGFAGLDLNRELGRGDLDLRNRTLSQQGALGRGDLAMRLLGTLMQNDQFYSGLGLNAAQLEALLNQNAVTSLFGGL